MIISAFMSHHPGRMAKKKKGDPSRHRTTYRAARRNIAKIAYRRAKRGQRG